MHFEINDGQDLDDCERALAAIRKYNGGAPAPAPAPAPSGAPGGYPTIRKGSW